MNSAKSTVPFKGTPEQEAELLKVIEEKKNDKGSLMPILQKAQEIYGYLPIEVQAIISDNTGIPLPLFRIICAIFIRSYTVV